METGTKVIVANGAGCVALVVVGAAAAALILTRSHFGGTSSPIAGDADVELTLTREGGERAADGAIMMSRLSDLGVDAELLEAGPGSVRLRASGVTSPQAVADVVSPGRRLAFYLVDESDNPFAPAAVANPPPDAYPMSDGQRTVLGGRSADIAREVAARVDLPPSRKALVECRHHGEPEVNDCFPHVVEWPAALTGESVAEAHAQDPQEAWASGPSVMIAFDAVGAGRFADVTAAAIHRKLAIVLDDQIMSCPLIQTAIPGGHAMITLTPGDSMSDARLLAAGLAPGRALAGNCQVERAVIVTPGE